MAAKMEKWRKMAKIPFLRPFFHFSGHFSAISEFPFSFPFSPGFCAGPHLKGYFYFARFQGNIIYPPPSFSPHVGQKAFFRQRGGGVYFEAPRGRNFICPPSFTRPPRLEGYFQGGCVYKIWPRKGYLWRAPPRKYPLKHAHCNIQVILTLQGYFVPCKLKG